MCVKVSDHNVLFSSSKSGAHAGFFPDETIIYLYYIGCSREDRLINCRCSLPTVCWKPILLRSWTSYPRLSRQDLHLLLLHPLSSSTMAGAPLMSLSLPQPVLHCYRRLRLVRSKVNKCRCTSSSSSSCLHSFLSLAGRSPGSPLTGGPARLNGSAFPPY